MSKPHEMITAAIRRATAAGGTALVPYITAGYPHKDRFIATLKAIAREADVVEVGVPFSDPMADGVTIQRASHAAIGSLKGTPTSTTSASRAMAFSVAMKRSLRG